jgi:hypothetical protein
MREIVEPVDLCEADGRLSEGAVGWSRQPLHRCNLERRWRKRWDWWAVTDGRWILMLCVADLDYAGLGLVSLLDTHTGQKFERALPFRVPLGEMPGEVRFDRLGMRIELSPRRLFASVGKLRAEIELSAPGETVNVVVPWSADRFWFTSKQIGLPARGRIEWGSRTIYMDGWAALDFGRGRWPARARWNWGVGVEEGVAFNLGARWTDGTGATENGLVVDGKLTKIHQPVRFEPGWRIRGEGVSLDFVPQFERRLGLPPLFGLHWCAGHFNGQVLERKISRAFGWAEALDILW